MIRYTQRKFKKKKKIIKTNTNIANKTVADSLRLVRINKILFQTLNLKQKSQAIESFSKS